MVNTVAFLFLFTLRLLAKQSQKKNHFQLNQTENTPNYTDFIPFPNRAKESVPRHELTSFQVLGKEYPLLIV